MLQAERCQRPRRLADVPLDGMQAKAAVGDVRGADVLRRRNQVAQPNGHQCAERNLERACATTDAHVFRTSAMNVDGVPAHADRIIDMGSSWSALKMSRHILLNHGSQRLDAAGLANVGKFGQSI